MIYQESKFKPNAKSIRRGRADATSAGDREGNRRPHGRLEFQVSDLYDPEINIRYGAWYLRHLLDKYHSERVALAAYNAGQANVDSWRKRGIGVQFDETQRLRRSRRKPEKDVSTRLLVIETTNRHLTDS